MGTNNNDTIDLYHDELTKLEEKERKKIEKFKKKEEKDKRKQEKRLEKLENKEFAKRQKMSREARYNPTQNTIDTLLPNIYKITILITLFMTASYFLYSLIKQQIHILNSILFTLIMFGFILSSTIQKRKERKIVTIITCTLCIVWMLLHL